MTAQGINIPKAISCHLKNLDGLTSRDILGGLETVKTYEDDSHLVRKLCRCRNCGQLYFYEFYEEIDWVGGEDPQYRTLVPVTDEQSAEELNKLPPIALNAYPAIRMDFPREAEVPEKPRWANLNKMSS